MNKTKVGIVGARGYTGGELIRLVIHHPNVELISATTRGEEKNISEVHQDLVGEIELKLTKDLTGDEEVIFLCLGHGLSFEFLKSNPELKDKIIIDLSNDFRLKQDSENEFGEFIYGLPELNFNEIRQAQKIANPGCFATAIQLAVLPLAYSGFLTNSVHVSATTGSTGAGVGLSETLHFSWRNQNVSPYKTFTHQHLGEITESIKQLQNGFDYPIYFLPYRGNFTRGIFASAYTNFKGSLNEAYDLFTTYYQTHPFVKVSEKPIDLKQVVNTNNCFIHLELEKEMLIIHSAIDNLLKGASGQAIQNLNILMGWNQKSGLNLKANYF